MNNWRFLTNHFKLFNPLKTMYVTQGFGPQTNPSLKDLYKSLGLTGHNGLDLRAPMDTDAFACFKGSVISAQEDSTGGKELKLRSDEKLISGISYRLEAIYYHLNDWIAKQGAGVLLGERIAKTGNTGKYTTAPHLHFGLKIQWKEGSVWKTDYTNGYRGAVDPWPFFENPERLPVDNRYGQTKDQIKEYWMRFKNQWLHRQFYNDLNRHPLSITNQELNALVYGYWDYESVFKRPEMYTFWSQQTKPAYLAKEPINN